MKHMKVPACKKIISIASLLFITITTAFTQNVGIGTTDPKARLHVADSSVVFAAPGFAAGITAPPVSGAGRRMMWYAERGAFRAGVVTADQWDHNNIGIYSTAFGFSNIAKGVGSFATGSANYVEGVYSTAIGNTNYATGANTVAIGNLAGAEGDQSSSIGTGTVSTSFQSTALGRFNYLAGNLNTDIPTDPLLVIGNGTSSGNRSNAITVLKNGNTGIGIHQPLVRLHVADSSVIFSGPQSVPPGVAPVPIQGPGIRLMWLPDRAAFRAGGISLDEWDDSRIGSYSTAFGLSNIASGVTSFATGLGNVASGNISACIGTYNNAPGLKSTAIGVGINTRTFEGIALGRYNVVSGNQTSDVSTDPIFTVGNGTSSVLRSNALAILKNGDVSIGDITPTEKLDIDGQLRIRGGEPANGKILISNATGVASWQNPSTLSLDQASATGISQVEFRNAGVYRGAFGWSQADGRFFFYDGESATNTLFINNGRMGIRRDATTNALEVGGDASKSTAGSWLGNSDARLKKNITPVTQALDNLLKLQGVQYEWNDAQTGYPRPAGRQMGFTAQNVQEVFPEKVSTDAQGYLQTAYGTYDPLIVEAIRELKNENEALKKEIAEIKQLMRKN